MKHSATILYSFFLLIGDFLALVAAFVGGYLLRARVGDKPIYAPIPTRTLLLTFLGIALFWLVIFALLGLYNRAVYEKRFSEMGRLLMGSFIGFLFVVGLAYFSEQPIFPAKLVPIYGFVLASITLIVFRTLARIIRRILFGQNIGISNVLLVGNTEVTENFIDMFSEPEKSGFKVIGVVSDSLKNVSVPVYKNFDEAVAHIKKKRLPHVVIQTELYVSAHKNNDILDWAQTNHVAYRFIPGNTELFVGNIEVELFQGSIPMIAVHQTALFGWGRIAKRLFDFSFATFTTIILSPLLLVIAILSFIFDPGPIFFRQERITRYNTKFRIFKFRTMKRRYNGLSPEQAFERMGKPELATKYRENGDQLPNDPRLTRFGRFLRKTSLDELPQLFNVIRGDISLVGPRALVPEEIEAANAKEHIVSVKSGMTGLAQVAGRKDITFSERRKLDLYYVQNWSFWLDIIILIKTLRVIVNRSAQ